MPCYRAHFEMFITRQRSLVAFRALCVHSSITYGYVARQEPF